MQIRLQGVYKVTKHGTVFMFLQGAPEKPHKVLQVISVEPFAVK